MKVSVLPASAPAGVHTMQLVTRDEVIGRWDKPAYRWSFQVQDGKFAGQQATRLTGTELRLGESLADFLGEIGMACEVGTDVDLDEPLGRVFTLVLTTGNGSGTRIAKIAPNVE